MNAWRVLSLLLLVLGLALATGSPVLVSVAYLLAGLLAVSWLWSRVSLAGIYLYQDLRSDRLQVGEESVEQLTLRSASMLPLLWVVVRDGGTLPGRERGRVVSVGPRGTVSWSVRTPCRWRGQYRLGPTELRSSDPFGCFMVRRRLAATRRILVLPTTVPLPGFELPSHELPGGVKTRASGGQSSAQVAGVRDYFAGDPISRIHWPSTLRAGRLIVKELEREPAADVWIALDLHADAQRGAGLESTEEYGVTVAASIACRFLELGRTVALTMQGDRHIVIQPDRGERQLVRLLEALAVVRATGTTSFADLLESDAARPDRDAALVAITPSVDPDWPEALAMAGARGAKALAVLLEPSTFGGHESSLPLVAALALAGVTTYLVKRGEPLADVLQSRVRDPSPSGRRIG